MADGVPAAASQSLYGDGHAAERVADVVCQLVRRGEGCTE